jgi:hypothetical protein
MAAWTAKSVSWLHAHFSREIVNAFQSADGGPKLPIDAQPPQFAGNVTCSARDVGVSVSSTETEFAIPSARDLHQRRT